MNEICFIKLSSNGDKHGAYRIQMEDVNTRRLGILYKVLFLNSDLESNYLRLHYLKQLDPSSIFLTNQKSGDVATIWPRNDGTFDPLLNYIDYYVNGDPENTSLNPNVVQASNVSTFKSSFGAGQQQIINNNSALKKVNISFSKKAKTTVSNSNIQRYETQA